MLYRSFHHSYNLFACSFSTDRDCVYSTMFSRSRARSRTPRTIIIHRTRTAEDLDSDAPRLKNFKESSPWARNEIEVKRDRNEVTDLPDSPARLNEIFFSFLHSTQIWHFELEGIKTITSRNRDKKKYLAHWLSLLKLFSMLSHCPFHFILISFVLCLHHLWNGIPSSAYLYTKLEIESFFSSVIVLAAEAISTWPLHFLPPSLPPPPSDPFSSFVTINLPSR